MNSERMVLDLVMMLASSTPTDEYMIFGPGSWGKGPDAARATLWIDQSLAMRPAVRNKSELRGARRNEPCDCGCGKKRKKCDGKPAGQTRKLHHSYEPHPIFNKAIDALCYTTDNPEEHPDATRTT